jgi:hypothetical protein
MITRPQVEQAHETQARSARVRPRAFALGLALMTLNIYWITVIEVRWYTLDITSLPIFITPIFTLFVVALLNWLLRLYRGASLFTGAELTVVYIIMVTGAVFAGHDMLQNLFGTIAYLQRHGTPETGWRERFFAYVPHALFVWDEDAVRAYYNGGVSPYRWDWLLLWAKPLALWAGLILTLVADVPMPELSGAEAVDAGREVGVPADSAPVGDGGAIGRVLALALRCGRGLPSRFRSAG